MTTQTIPVEREHSTKHDIIHLVAKDRINEVPVIALCGYNFRRAFDPAKAKKEPNCVVCLGLSNNPKWKL